MRSALGLALLLLGTAVDGGAPPPAPPDAGPDSGAPAAPAGPRSDVTFGCEGCFGLLATLDGAPLISVLGVGAAWVDGRPRAGREVGLADASPGLHDLEVTLLDGPLESRLAWRGSIYVRPARDLRFRVRPGGVELVESGPRSAVDGGAPASAEDGGPTPDASLALRLDDDGRCVLWLDGEPRAWLTPATRESRLAWMPRVSPGLHRVELRDEESKSLLRGTLFLPRGDDEVLAVRCQRPALAAQHDSAALTVERRGR